MSQVPETTELAPERAATVIPYFASYEQPSQARLDETSGLVEALGCEAVVTRAERIREPSASHLLPGGIRERLAQDIAEQECTICIVDGTLTPVQQRNLERDLKVKVIDRTGLILEIFGLRARTREGRLQVELARILYERSRLVRTWTHLERQRGGSGFLSGPGETQLEADRRMLDTTIRRLKAGLEDVRKTRRLQRAGRKRRDAAIVALVGYTNAGKSTLFNTLTGAKVFAKDMPFATLDPTIRSAVLPSGREIALVDTVGFITDLPVHLVESFQATLEEVLDANLLIHVRDRSTDQDASQKADVLRVLEQLEEQSDGDLPPIIEVWNKADVLEPETHDAFAVSQLQSEPPAALVSAVTGEGFDRLLNLIERELAQSMSLLDITLQPSQGDVRAWLHEHADVISETIGEDGSIRLHVRVDHDARGRLASRFPDLKDELV